ncbi:MAG: methylmalonyl Co-A mutase-associated GTPase MeaB [Myxococcota bacterium]|nr:methylmalonyl Co-A mutase-associated GTPase MeaB [Myxococcota bacterium]
MKSARALADAALARDILAGARIIRLLDDRDEHGIEALAHLYPSSGRAYVLGVTGPPGAGKSTLVSKLIGALRKRDLTVGVLAIDPTSPFSGGAILGDRVRMQEHATDEGAFIRSMATRGQLGGLSRSTFEASAVLDAMGFDVVLVETVGVGQDELDVVELAHTTVVVSVPGLGDGIQAMKAGILEVGDVHVINKSDLPGADELERQLHVMLETEAHREGAWKPRLLRTVAEKGEGVEELVDGCFAHREHLQATGEDERVAARRAEHFFLEILRDEVSARILAFARGDAAGAALLEDVRARRRDPYAAAAALLDAFEANPQTKR